MSTNKADQFVKNSPDRVRQTPNWNRLAGSVGSSAWFNLIYLVFLFFPWMFASPRWIDTTVAAVALAIFVPVHFRAFEAPAKERLLAIGIVAVLGCVTSFFILGSGVFAIYCGAMAGFLRPVRRSGIVVAVCVAAYLLAAYLAGRAVTEHFFVVLMSMIVWFSTLSTSQSMLDSAQLEREQELDLQTASLMERERIGRDLHDLLGHTLTMVALKSDLANRLLDTDPEQARQQIEEIQEASRQALSDVRQALSGLASISVSSELDNAAAALEAANVALTIAGDVPTLTSDQDQVYGMMIREAVTNVIRHTEATTVTIHFKSTDQDRQLTISDNGGGEIESEGRGLAGLRKRIESLGGSVRIGADAGVSLSATIPVAAA